MKRRELRSHFNFDLLLLVANNARVCSMFLSCAAGQAVRTFELSSEAIAPLRSMASQSDRVTCARYNHNGRILASSAVDGGICLDVAGSGELLSRFFYPSTSPRDRVSAIMDEGIG